MSRIIDRFPNIKKAFIEMSYDNGGINIHRTEEDAYNETEQVLSAEGVVEEDLQTLDDWIGTLTDDQIQMLVAGEESERIEMEEKLNSPRGGPDNELLSNIFNDLFEVC